MDGSEIGAGKGYRQSSFRDESGGGPWGYGFATVFESTNLIEWRMTRPRPLEERSSGPLDLAEFRIGHEGREDAAFFVIQPAIYVTHVYQGLRSTQEHPDLCENVVDRWLW